MIKSDAALLRIAKKTKARCVACNCVMQTHFGQPVFSNDNMMGMKLDAEGNSYCYSCARKLGITVWKIPEWKEPDRLEDFEEKCKAIQNLPEGTHFEAYEQNSHIKVRACKEEGGLIFVFKHNSRKYGYRFSQKVFCNKYDLKQINTNVLSEEEKRQKRIKSVISKLEKSGLWPDLLEKLRNLQKIDADDREKLKKVYWDEKAYFDSEKYEELRNKYPFLFYASDGHSYLDTFYLFEMSDVKLKSMYFGKGRNAVVKDAFAKAILEKKDFEECVTVGYDVSLTYLAEQNKAWYSEEYRGCGNGHYYIAIDSNTAWFCEDD